MTNQSLLDQDNSDSELGTTEKTKQPKSKKSEKEQEFKDWRAAVLSGKGATWEQEHGGTPWRHEDDIKDARQADNDYLAMLADEQARLMLQRMPKQQRRAIANRIAQRVLEEETE